MIFKTSLLDQNYSKIFKNGMTRTKSTKELLAL